jgi:hypothetical protein
MNSNQEGRIMRKTMNGSLFLSAVILLNATLGLYAQIAEVTPRAPLDLVHAESPSTVTKTVRSETSGTGTQDQIAKWTDNAGTLGDSGLSVVNGLLSFGTSSLSGRLHLVGPATGDIFAGMGVDLGTGPAFNYGYAGFTNGRSAGFFNVRADAQATAPNPSLRFATADTVRMIITSDGRVGIGYGIGKDANTTVPTEKLGVLGNIHATGSISADGAMYAKFQDIAEWVSAKTKLEPGTVVILNPERRNEVMASTTSYDTSVAGVVSAQPGLTLGVRGEGKAQIATTGRVQVRIDARSAPIRIGDLLVTGDQPGTAMPSEPMVLNGRKFHQPGTIIGKALEEHAGGEGEILVLLSLQ